MKGFTMCGIHDDGMKNNHGARVWPVCLMPAYTDIKNTAACWALNDTRKSSPTFPGPLISSFARPVCPFCVWPPLRQLPTSRSLFDTSPRLFQDRHRHRLYIQEHGRLLDPVRHLKFVQSRQPGFSSKYQSDFKPLFHGGNIRNKIEYPWI